MSRLAFISGLSPIDSDKGIMRFSPSIEYPVHRDYFPDTIMLHILVSEAL